MKKHIMLITFVFILLFIFSACSRIADSTGQLTDDIKQSSETSNDDLGTENSSDVLDDNTEENNESTDLDTYFRIYTEYGESKIEGYTCEIYNREGETVRVISGIQPKNGRMINDHILDISIDYGTATVAHTYYDVDQDIFSREYIYVLGCNGDLVAYIDVPETDPMENRKIVVCDIFDENKTEKEFSLELAHDPFPIVDSYFSDDGSTLTVTYYSKDNTKNTASFELDISDRE